MNFEPTNFISSLEYLAVGMISIFVVIGEIVLVTVLLNKIFRPGGKKKHFTVFFIPKKAINFH